MSVAEERTAVVGETVARIRKIEAEKGVTREALGAIKAELLALAARAELFPAGDFPVPSQGGSRMHTLSIDQDQRFALYLDCCDDDVETPPHNHTTWAVITGVQGQELNRFYEETGQPAGGGRGPLAQVREYMVEPGTGVAMMPDDFHSIHVSGGRTNMNLHMYGLGLPELTERVKYDFGTGQYAPFLPHPDA